MQHSNFLVNNRSIKLALASLITLFTLSFLSGCTTIVGATTDEPITPDPTKRSFGTYIDDQNLETIAKVNLRKASPDLKASNISVVSYNGIILLTGQVPTQNLRLLAGETVKNLHKVRQVFNEIQVQGKTSFLSRTNDAWLTTKVKSVLIANSDIESRRIKVVTEDGVVYLLGLLSRPEAEQAAQVISQIGGVQKVVKAIEYIN